MEGPSKTTTVPVDWTNSLVQYHRVQEVWLQPQPAVGGTLDR